MDKGTVSEVKDKIKSLVSHRGTLKAKITKFENRLPNFESRGSITELKLRLSKVEALWDEFDQIQTEIEILDQTQVNERDLFEDNYFKVVATASTMIASLQQNQSDSLQPLMINTSPNTNTRAV